MKKLKLIPKIPVYNGLVGDNKNESGTQNADVVNTASMYNNKCADALIFFDISDNDKEHDANIVAVAKAADVVDIPIIIGGNVKRLEDVKKYIYAGASVAVLDCDDENNRLLVKEAVKRFGSQKIAISISEKSNPIDISQCVRDGASLILADNLKNAPDYGVDVIYESTDISDEEAKSFFASGFAYGISLEKFSPDFDIMDFKLRLKSAGIDTEIFEPAMRFNEFKFDSRGLIPVIVQDYRTDKVLMLAYMNSEAYRLTIDTGKMTYFSRSRNEIWVKGETSGNYQYVKELTMDCDLDTMLAKVSQVGVPCHTGADTCFFNQIVSRGKKPQNPETVLKDVYNTISDRKENPKEGSYTNYLFDKGIDKILKKIGEETTEIVIASKNPEKQELKYEISDLMYHITVLMVEKNMTWKEILTELSRR